MENSNLWRTGICENINKIMGVMKFRHYSYVSEKKFNVICLVITKMIEKVIKFYTLTNVKVFIIPKFLLPNPKEWQ